MKKVALLAVLFSLITFSAKAQWFDFSNNNSVSIGFNAGAVGYHLGNKGLNTDYLGVGFGASVTLQGAYIDFIYQSPEHRYSSLVGVDDWNDHTALSINVGYQIPVLHWLYVTPMIGYSNETTGLTLANQITAEHSEIVHKYERDHIYNHFNYGIGLTVKPLEWLGIGGVATSHALYGNISLYLTEGLVKK